MKRVLIVKMSSMGDVLHTLPAVTDAKQALADIEFDWVVEPGFQEIPRWHPAVNEVFTAPLRRWRKAPWQAIKSGEWSTLFRALRKHSYDAVIDAQGLLKSAFISRLAKGPRYGASFNSAREPLASLAYTHHFKGAKVTEQHAVKRMRALFAHVLNYPLPLTAVDYGIDKKRLANLSYGDNNIIFLHGTTWDTKHWPTTYWQQLALLASKAGFNVLLPWGNEEEWLRAQAICDFVKDHGLMHTPTVLPRLTLSEITALIARAQGIVAVDTGLGHVAAAMATPTVSLYGSTDPFLTGAYGPSQVHLKVNYPCAPCLNRQCKLGQHFEIFPPCFSTLTPEKVWQTLMEHIAVKREISI